MLVLSEQDILQTVTMDDVIQMIEEAYILYESNHFAMPLRQQVSEQNNTMLLMPCIAKNSTGLKIVNVYPNNHEVPVTQGTMILHNRANGAVKAILNGTLLTGIRTGAIGGTAIKYLAPENVQSIGLIGTGFQGLYQLIAACAVREIKHIYLWNRTASKITLFIQKLQSCLTKDIKIHITNKISDLVEQSDIIILSTSSYKPVLPNIENGFNGKLIIGIGSYRPQMREFPKSIYENLDSLYIDSLDAIQESGDLIDPIQNRWLAESQIIPFSKILTNKVRSEFSIQKPTVFKSTGMALFDLVVAEMIVEKALEHQIGQLVEM